MPSPALMAAEINPMVTVPTVPMTVRCKRVKPNLKGGRAASCAAWGVVVEVML
ncbi:hypothetical protein GCM10009720_04910 [Yaniella flava]|uniref:Uncharacterized protein n=1 Tax=Yaniella flava TaxID=287930 RepID=A0ABN2U529_9MICC